MASSWNDCEDETRTSISEVDLEENYYSILNVPTNATDKEITHAYHRYGLVYHPDKHKNLVDKRNAEKLFSKIKEAYDVLISPHKRAIYDSVGIKGLGQDGLQIVIHSKTPKEIREEYERLSKEREEKRLEKLTFSQGNFSLGLNASNLFERKKYYQSERDFQNSAYFEIQNYSMVQSVDFPITSKDTVTLTGSLDTDESERGTGSVTTAFRRMLSGSSYIDVKGTLGAKPGFTFYGFKRFTNRLKGSSLTTFQYTRGRLAPIFLNTANYQFTENLQGQLSYKTDISFMLAAMSTSLFYFWDTYHAELKLNLSVRNTYLSLDLSKSFWEDTLKLKGRFKYGYTGTTFAYAVEKQITRHTRVDTHIIISNVSGVALNLEIHRGNQSFTVPITLANEIMPSAVFYGTVTPIIAYYVFKRLVIDPYKKEKEESEANKMQEKLKAELLEKRRLALAAQELMKETVLRIIEREGQHGLIITKAIYGKIVDKHNPNFETEKIINVMIPIQLLVSDHSFNILSDQSKSNLEGFYDPCIGETKTLYIEYTFRTEKYQVTCGDTENLRMPKASHKVQWWSKTFNSVRA